MWRSTIAVLPGVSVAAVLALVTATSNVSIAVDEPYPEFAEPTLQQGRVIWIATCKVCHTADFAGAPKVTDKAAWAPRLAKGKDVLYSHAMQGVYGPSGTEMPPRGGNPALTDEQVRAAVDYMVALVAK
jgi:cytochrome c5